MNLWNLTQPSRLLWNRSQRSRVPHTCGMTQGSFDLLQAQSRRSLSGNPPTLVSFSRSICIPGSEGMQPHATGKLMSWWPPSGWKTVDTLWTTEALLSVLKSRGCQQVLNSKELLEIKCPVMGKGWYSLDDVFNGKVMWRWWRAHPNCNHMGHVGTKCRCKLVCFAQDWEKVRCSFRLRPSKLSSLFPMMHSSVQRLSWG